MKKIVSFLLTLCMAFGFCTSALAAGLTSGGQKTPFVTPGGSDNTEVRLSIGDGESGGAGSGAFRVSVPTALPFSVSSSGVVSTATDARIINGSNAPVKVTKVVARGANGWSIVANGTTFSRVAVNSRQFTLSLNGDNFPAAAANSNSTLPLTDARWPSLDGNGGSLPLTYSGRFAAQNYNSSGAKIADVIFTVAWSTGS